jgi:hypothetical protein
VIARLFGKPCCLATSMVALIPVITMQAVWNQGHNNEKLHLVLALFGVRHCLCLAASVIISALAKAYFADGTSSLRM